MNKKLTKTIRQARNLPITYWRAVGVLFAIAVVLQFFHVHAAQMFMARVILLVLFAGAIVRLTKPGSGLLKLLLLIFVIVVGIGLLGHISFGG